MAWRIVRQPNGKLARFSDVVDNFTHYDMTDQEAFDLCFEKMGREDSECKVARADEPGRYESCLSDIRVVHGEEESRKMDELLRGDSVTPNPETM